MSSFEEKKKLVMEKCSCTESDAEGALRKAGLDVEMAVKNIRESFRATATGGYHKSVNSVLKQSAHVKGLSKDMREDIAMRAELASQGWEEVGGKAKAKKQSQELKRIMEEEERRRSYHQQRRSQNLRVSKPNKSMKSTPETEEKPKEPEAKPVVEEPKKVEEQKPAPVPEPQPAPVEEPKKVEPEPVPEPVPEVKPEPVKEEEPKKEEEKPAEPAKEAAPATSHKRKLTIVRANQVKAENAEPEKTEVAATEYKPPLVHAEPEPEPQPKA